MMVANKLIVDTGYFVALLSARDKYHDRSLEIARAAKEEHRLFITTWPVLTEVCHLLQRFAPNCIVPFLESYRRGAFELFELGSEAADRIVELVKKYRGLPMDLADASLVILAEALGHGEILSTDVKDFKIYRWKQRRPFKNLFLG